MNKLFLPEKQKIEIDVSQIHVNPVQVLNGLGMKPEDADDYLLEIINDLIVQCAKLARVKAGFSSFIQPDLDITNGILFLEDSRFALGKIVTTALKKSEVLILFAVTIGNEVETFSRKLIKDDDTLEGLIADLIGSELAEASAGFLHDYLQIQMSKKGYGVTNRYSPGYCNWPVSDQHQLFERLAGVNCGISLNDSALMSPVKSVSGIIGVGKGLKRAEYKCRLCNDKNCILREQF